MNYQKPRLSIDGSIRDIFSETLALIKEHILPLSLIWGIFYIPTNVFILLRSGEMMRHLGSGSPLVLPAILFLSLLGTVPNIAIVLLTARGGCEDYNQLVADAFRKLPFYVTTTLVMLLRMLPLMILGMVLSSLAAIAMESMGMEPLTQVVVITLLIIAFGFLAFIRYYSSVPFYLVKGVRNLQATFLSTILFACNRKKILAAFGICSFAPMTVNLLTLYYVENEAAHIVLGFILGYFMFISSALYAGLFNHIRDLSGEETVLSEDGASADPESSLPESTDSE